MRYILVGWVHRNREDDYPVSACLGSCPGTPDGLEEAEGVAKELMKMLGSKDTTDFEVVAAPKELEKCAVCAMRKYCEVEEEGNGN